MERLTHCRSLQRTPMTTSLHNNSLYTSNGAQILQDGEHTGDESRGVPSWGQRQCTTFRLNLITLSV